MEFHKEILDLILVPSGLLVMIAYHPFLLYRYIKWPHKTVLGFENNDKRAWVEGIMQADKKDVGTALTVIQSSITTATFFASVSLTLCAVIGAWCANSSSNFFQSELIYGDTRPTTISIKYMCLLISFLIAFSFFVQSNRHFVHANYLISSSDYQKEILVSSVEEAVIRGGDFWSVGLCALYFALNLLLWFFGPIPFFVSSVVMAMILYIHDNNSRPFHTHRSPGSMMQKSKKGFFYEGIPELA